MQKVLVMTTSGGSLRSEAEGWSAEDANLVVRNKPVGFTPGILKVYPTNPLFALADGWKLLAPPVKYQIGTSAKPIYQWDWWFVKD